jgi:hypothetical protein
MAPEALSQVDVGWHGLVGDRRWAFVRPGMAASGFPWLTLRERGAMWHYQPAFLEPDRPDKSPTVVRTPAGQTFDVTDPQLAEQLCSGSRVIRQDRGVFDTFPLSIITTRTIAGLGEWVGGASLETARFRPNFLVEATDRTPFAEDSWVGSVVRIGGLRMRADKRDGRCVVITIDPATTERNPAIHRAVASERQGCLGIYGTTVTPGRVAINDEVILESSSEGQGA